MKGILFPVSWVYEKEIYYGGSYIVIKLIGRPYYIFPNYDLNTDMIVKHI